MKWFLPVLIAGAIVTLPAQAQSPSAAIEAAIQPYVDSRSFAGAVLVARDGSIVFDKAYGYANVEAGVPNTISTSFHIGELSMAYTAAVVMHLAEKKALSLDNTVAQFLPDVPKGDRITIRDLLAGRIAAPSPGEARDSGSDRRAAYGLLARIVALQSSTSFGESLNALIFAPYWMDGAGLDSGNLEPARRYAEGYVQDGGVLKPASTANWSSMTGSASLYTTPRDELRFVEALFGDDLLKPETRAAMFEGAKPGFGFGWFESDDAMPGGRSYAMSGREGGFSAFVLHNPAANATVIVFSNTDPAPVTEMGRAIAALALAKP